MSPTAPSASLSARLAGARFGVFVTLALFSAVAGAWAAYAPLSAASIAAGIVSPDSGRKTVQHLEGGIVERVLISEGETVSAGQPLIVLVDAKAKAQLDLNIRRQLELNVQRARIDALATGAPFNGQTFLTSGADQPGFASFVASEAALYQAMLGGHSARMASLMQDLGKSNEARASAQSQIAALDDELELVQSERGDVEGLLDKGLTTRPRSLALKRREAQIAAQRAQLDQQLQAAIADASQRRSAFEAEEASWRAMLSQEAARIETDLSTIASQIAATADVVKRMQVMAPQDGVVVALRIKTPGAVLPPGAPVVDLVPVSDTLVLDVRVKPQDIANVHPGQTARISVSAFPLRETPVLRATVTSVSADAIQDAATRETYYRAELKLLPEDVAALPATLKLLPGMPVEAYVEHRARTALEWLAEPILRSMQRAGRG
jgi:HlyD family type I secretion membrane fusion protein